MTCLVLAVGVGLQSPLPLYLRRAVDVGQGRRLANARRMGRCALGDLILSQTVQANLLTVVSTLPVAEH